MLIWK